MGARSAGEAPDRVACRPATGQGAGGEAPTGQRAGVHPVSTATGEGAGRA